jgi:hypothetical protein
VLEIQEVAVKTVVAASYEVLLILKMCSVGHGLGNSIGQSVSTTQRMSHLLWNPEVYNHFLKQVNPVRTVVSFPL